MCKIPCVVGEEAQVSGSDERCSNPFLALNWPQIIAKPSFPGIFILTFRGGKGDYVRDRTRKRLPSTVPGT